jgi:hypothetical protein
MTPLTSRASAQRNPRARQFTTSPEDLQQLQNDFERDGAVMPRKPLMAAIGICKKKII